MVTLFKHIKRWFALGDPPFLANHFGQSALKQRLMMLMKDQSTPARAFRYSLLLPLGVLFVFLFHRVEVSAQSYESLNFTFNKFFSHGPIVSARQLEENNWTYTDTMWNKPANTPAGPFSVMTFDMSPIPDAEGGLIYRQADIAPKFRMNWRRFVKENTQFFQEKAKKAQIYCVVWVTAVIEKDGTISKVKVLSPNNYDDHIFLDYPEYRAEAGRVVGLMREAWTPAQHHGEPVRYEYLFQIEFGQ